VAGRVLLVGTESAAGMIRQVCELPIVGLHACTLEPFRIGGRERFAVRWLATPSQVPPAKQTSSDVFGDDVSAPRPTVAEPGTGSARCGVSPEFVVPAQRLSLWHALLSICDRMDSAVIVHGDRFSRSISWNGKSLGEVRSVGSSLVASSATGVVRDL